MYMDSAFVGLNLLFVSVYECYCQIYEIVRTCTMLTSMFYPKDYDSDVRLLELSTRTTVVIMLNTVTVAPHQERTISSTWTIRSGLT